MGKIWSEMIQMNQKFCNVHRETTVLKYLFNNVASLKACTFIKNRLQLMCFPANIAKFQKQLFYWTPPVAASDTRSKGLQPPKMCGCALNAIVATSNIANMLLDLKTNKDQTGTNIMKALTQTCTDSKAILGHVQSTIEQNWRDNIVACLDSQYRRLSKNGPPDSEWLLANKIPKNVMTATTNKNMLIKNSTSFTTSSSSLNKKSKIFWWFPQTLEIIPQQGLL